MLTGVPRVKPEPGPWQLSWAVREQAQWASPRPASTSLYTEYPSLPPGAVAAALAYGATLAR